MEIRKAKSDDATRLVNLFDVLDRETEFMMMEPGERQLTIEKQVHIVEEISKSDSKILFVASEEEELIGFLGGTGGSVNRNQHSISIAMGVLATHWSKGIGTQLLESLFLWAKANNFHRIELTVIESNHRAKSLYEKLGFKAEGLKQHSLLVGDNFVNENYMAKLI